MPTVTPSQMGNPVQAQQQPVAQPDQPVYDNNQGTPTSPEATEAKKPGEQEFSAKFAALSRQERKMRQSFQSQRQQLATEKAQIEASRAEIEKAKGWQSRLQEDPWSTMIEAGLSPDQISDRVFSPDAIQKYNLQRYQSELEKKVQSQIDALKQQQEESSNSQYAQAKKQMAWDVSRLVDQNTAQYEAIKSMGAQEAVVSLIEETFKQTGNIMDMEEAAREVEDYLVEQAMGLTKIQKIKSKFLPELTQGIQKQAPPQKPQATTLSNRTMTSTSTAPLSDRQRRERAIAAFMGKQT